MYFSGAQGPWASAYRAPGGRVAFHRANTGGAVATLVHHSTHELREGLHDALGGAITQQLREVEPELRLVGFLADTTTVTPAGRRFLQDADTVDGPRLTAA